MHDVRKAQHLPVRVEIVTVCSVVSTLCAEQLEDLVSEAADSHRRCGLLCKAASEPRFCNKLMQVQQRFVLNIYTDDRGISLCGMHSRENKCSLNKITTMCVLFTLIN